MALSVPEVMTEGQLTNTTTTTTTTRTTKTPGTPKKCPATVGYILLNPFNIGGWSVTCRRQQEPQGEIPAASIKGVKLLI